MLLQHPKPQLRQQHVPVLAKGGLQFPRTLPAHTGINQVVVVQEPQLAFCDDPRLVATLERLETG